MTQHDLNEDDADDAEDLKNAKQGKYAVSVRGKEVVNSAIILEEDMADQILETETMEIEDTDEVDEDDTIEATGTEIKQPAQTQSR